MREDLRKVVTENAAVLINQHFFNEKACLKCLKCGPPFFATLVMKDGMPPQFFLYSRKVGRKNMFSDVITD